MWLLQGAAGERCRKTRTHGWSGYVGETYASFHHDSRWLNKWRAERPLTTAFYAEHLRRLVAAKDLKRWRAEREAS